MRLPTVHDGRSPLLQRPENQVRSVRGHVQVPCTGLLAGAPHTSKGQGARGMAATTAARQQMSQCWMTTMPSSLRPRDQPGPPQGQTVLGVVPPVLASGEWSCQCAVDRSVPWSTSYQRAGVGRLGQEWQYQTSSPLGLGVSIARLTSLAEGWACHVDPAVAS